MTFRGPALTFFSLTALEGAFVVADPVVVLSRHLPLLTEGLTLGRPLR